jgi:type IV pilus assembly protein PilA
MKSDLALKYLRFFRKRQNKKDDEGLSLIEILITMIMLGILVASLLPMLLEKIGKARETEIKNAVGSCIRIEMGYHFEKQTFAPAITLLGLVFPEEYVSNATAIVSSASATHATCNPENSNAVNDGTLAYAGRIEFLAGNYSAIICQSAGVATAIPILTSATACPPPLNKIH